MVHEMVTKRESLSFTKYKSLKNYIDKRFFYFAKCTFLREKFISIEKPQKLW